MKNLILILLLFSCTPHLADKRKLCIVTEVTEVNEPTITEFNTKYTVTTDCGVRITTKKKFNVCDTLIMITR
jgi:hypothetical protein